jgi:ABC-type branched-subunit amino acid transport system substrate-binding protein
MNASLWRDPSIFKLASAFITQMQHAGMAARLLGLDGLCPDDLLPMVRVTLADDRVVCAPPGGVDRSDGSPAQTFLGDDTTRLGSAAQFYAANAAGAAMVLADAVLRCGPCLDADRDDQVDSTTRVWPLGQTVQVSIGRCRLDAVGQSTASCTR